MKTKKITVPEDMYDELVALSVQLKEKSVAPAAYTMHVMMIKVKDVWTENDYQSVNSALSEQGYPQMPIESQEWFENGRAGELEEWMTAQGISVNYRPVTRYYDLRSVSLVRGDIADMEVDKLYRNESLDGDLPRSDMRLLWDFLWGLTE